MGKEYRIETTVEPQKVLQVFELSGSEWGGDLTPREFAEVEAKALIDFILEGNPGRAFYVESKSGEVDALVIITQHKALYKDAGVTSLGSTPDPSLFGVKNATAIKISYVFVRKEKRRQGLMESLLLKAIEYTEAEILKKELAKSSDKKDSFKLMVMNGSEIDQSLVQHYLGKKYVWYLYSAIDEKYRKLGFKGYPLEGYEIPPSFGQGETQKLVERLLESGSPDTIGKKLHLLDGSKKLDMDLIQHILQGRELDLLTELNKDMFHSELTGNLRSSLSLTNLSSALSSARLGSQSELTSITEKLKENSIVEEEESGSKNDHNSGSSKSFGRRKSAILQQACSKFALLPDLKHFERRYGTLQLIAEKSNDEESMKFTHIYGAILTNELQKKSFYVLWMPIKLTQLYIVGMGEFKFDLFGAMTDPMGLTNPVGRRRGSSFTGLNDMGGFNFQDLDILVHTALYVSKRMGRKTQEAGVHVTLHDLPNSVPGVVLHDFFVNYLPKGLAAEHQDADDEGRQQVKFIENFTLIRTLPMVRKFGNKSAEFELDWIANSLVNWG